MYACMHTVHVPSMLGDVLVLYATLGSYTSEAIYSCCILYILTPPWSIPSEMEWMDSRASAYPRRERRKSIEQSNSLGAHVRTYVRTHIHAWGEKVINCGRKFFLSFLSQSNGQALYLVLLHMNYFSASKKE